MWIWGTVLPSEPPGWFQSATGLRTPAWMAFLPCTSSTLAVTRRLPGLGAQVTVREQKDKRDSHLLELWTWASHSPNDSPCQLTAPKIQTGPHSLVWLNPTQVCEPLTMRVGRCGYCFCHTLGTRPPATAHGTT
jgi:hypothetical protein